MHEEVHTTSSSTQQFRFLQYLQFYDSQQHVLRLISQTPTALVADLSQLFYLILQNCPNFYISRILLHSIMHLSWKFFKEVVFVTSQDQSNKQSMTLKMKRELKNNFRHDDSNAENTIPSLGDSCVRRQSLIPKPYVIGCLQRH